MGSKIGFEMSLIIVEVIRGRCASFITLHVWWTENPIYFSSIDVRFVTQIIGNYMTDIGVRLGHT